MFLLPLRGNFIAMKRAGRRRFVGPVALLGVLALAGCGGKQHSLAPASHQSRDIASLFWWMMAGSWIGIALVVFLLLWSWKRRNRRGFGRDRFGVKPGEKPSWFVVVGMGIVTPMIVIAALFVVSDIFLIRTTEAPAKGATDLTVDVTGHEWWWEFRYPGTKAVTANELHIPVRTPVRVVVHTADVIHSFWVPQLNRKIDTIPGQNNSIELDADHVGVFRGACAEFCGLQHAHMDFLVFADPPAVFRRWLANQAKPAAAPTSPLAKQGHDVFMSGTCSSCHAIRGTRAAGDVGPDLTHVGSRTSLAAVTIPNNGYLGGWIPDSQHFKPGNQMPDMNLGGRQLQALVAYLQGLK